ncbi:MAG: phenylalanine--tRNA ligase subunit alpha, partial [Patescibacteria group bacterium]|nr:phenylalanine--tRNA ligase subunit alpha [Patescibacteria group bacterium]
GKKLYGPETKLRMRPKYYPFVEPGSNGEYTCSICKGKGCRLCKYSGWLEILGCGMMHPNVLRAGGIDPKKYSGFAFGFGLGRLTQLKYGIEDNRLFMSGDMRFLGQF